VVVRVLRPRRPGQGAYEAEHRGGQGGAVGRSGVEHAGPGAKQVGEVSSRGCAHEEVPFPFMDAAHRGLSQPCGPSRSGDGSRTRRSAGRCPRGPLAVPCSRAARDAFLATPWAPEPLARACTPAVRKPAWVAALEDEDHVPAALRVGREDAVEEPCGYARHALGSESSGSRARARYSAGSATLGPARGSSFIKPALVLNGQVGPSPRFARARILRLASLDRSVAGSAATRARQPGLVVGAGFAVRMAH
jgi:hypothetical protein